MQRIEKVNHVTRSRFDFTVYEEPVTRILQAEKLRIGYSDPLCPELNLQVKKGEKIAIVGHNGIGKTTMLKTLLGQIKPLSGSISVGERVNPAYFAQEEFASEITPLEKIWAERPDMTKRSAPSISEVWIKRRACIKTYSFIKRRGTNESTFMRTDRNEKQCFNFR